MPTDAELLKELATLDTVEARIATNAEHTARVVPSWCEVILTLERDQRLLPIPMTRSDGELIIEVLHEVLHPNDGDKHPLTRMWEHMDDVMERLMNDLADPDDKGFALGVATCLAILSQRYSEEPDVDAIRMEAMERFEASDDD